MFLGMVVGLEKKSDIAARTETCRRKRDLHCSGNRRKEKKEMTVQETRQTHSELPPKPLANGVCTCRFG
jgi:hypothetical protein